VLIHYRALLLNVADGRWSQEGEYLVSGSDDHRLFIWSAYDKFAVRKVLDTGSHVVIVLIQVTRGIYSRQSLCRIRIIRKLYRVLEIDLSSFPR
jgi:hypothetical protein